MEIHICWRNKVKADIYWLSQTVLLIKLDPKSKHQMYLEIEYTFPHIRRGGGSQEFICLPAEHIVLPIKFSSLNQWANYFKYISFKINAGLKKEAATGNMEGLLVNATQPFCLTQMPSRIKGQGGHASYLNGLSLPDKLSLTFAGFQNILNRHKASMHISFHGLPFLQWNLFCSSSLCWISFSVSFHF